jgi:predicted RNA-binding Zn-ribbon protein involved in translation (DUF1610 family)
MSAGVPHPSGTKTWRATLSHGGEDHVVHVPADHDGSRIKVEFPDGQTAYIDGWDETERALQGERPVVACASCGARNVLTGTSFTCSACGVKNGVRVQTSSDAGTGSSREG